MNYYIVYKHNVFDSHCESVADSNSYSVVLVSKEDATMYALKGLCVYVFKEIKGGLRLNPYIMLKLKQHYNVVMYHEIPRVDFKSL